MPGVDDTGNELPSYGQHTRRTQTSRQVEHSYRLVKNGRSVLSLSVSSSAAHADDTPVMRQGQTIRGAAMVDLSEGMQVRTVTVQVIGELKMQFGSQRFLTQRIVLYSAQPEDEQSSNLTRPLRSSSSNTTWLRGKHVWPYSTKLPTGISISYGGPSDDRSNFRLPPSFKDAASKCCVEYTLLLHVKTGTWSSDYKLACPFQYSPLLKPPTPSVLHQIAQLEASETPGPEDDPDGWKTLPTITIQGKVFNFRPVTVTYTLHLPRPLCYTRGSSIPLYLSIASDDNQALDLLSCPHAPDVRLIRLSSFAQTTYTVGMVGASGTPISHTSDLATARFTTNSLDHPPYLSTGRRVLRGELTIPEDLVPDCRILHFQMQYYITIHSSSVAAFSPAIPAQQLKQPLLKHTVQIATVVTLPDMGLHDIAHAPPEYTADGAEMGL